MKRKGVKCTKCKTAIHVSCARLPAGHEIWTCIKCKRQSAGARPSMDRRVSILPAGPSRTMSSPAVSVNDRMMKEFSELKLTLASLADRITAMNECHQVELRAIQQVNRELREEIVVLKNIWTDIEKISTEKKLPPRQKTVSANSNEDIFEVEVRHTNTALWNELSLIESFSPADVLTNNPTTTLKLNSFSSGLSLEPECSISTGRIQEMALAVQRDYSTESMTSSSSKASSVIHSNETLRDLKSLVLQDDAVMSTLNATDTKAWISLSNVAPDTTAENIIEFIRKKLKTDDGAILCSKITPRSIVNPIYSSFKVGVPEYLIQHVTNEQFWPSEVVLKNFKNEANFRRTARIVVGS